MVTSLVKENGKTYAVVNDFGKLRELFGEMLREVQRIKSEGDYEAGKALVERYAVTVDPELHEEVRDRYYALSIEPLRRFRQSRIRTGGEGRQDRRRENFLPGQLCGADARLFEELFVPAQHQLVFDDCGAPAAHPSESPNGTSAEDYPSGDSSRCTTFAPH